VQARAATPAMSGCSRGTSWATSLRVLTEQLWSLSVPHLLGRAQGAAWAPQVPGTKSCAGPSPPPSSNTLGLKQRPRPWEAAARGHQEASPAWPWASSSLAVNYSECGSACSASAPATPPLMAKIDGFLISDGQKAPGRAAHGPVLAAELPQERGGPNLEGGLSRTHFHHFLPSI